MGQCSKCARVGDTERVRLDDGTVKPLCVGCAYAVQCSDTGNGARRLLTKTRGPEARMHPEFMERNLGVYIEHSRLPVDHSRRRRY